MKVKMAAASLLGSMAVLATVGFGTAAAQPGGGGHLTQQDRTFMAQNAQTDLAEIAGGKLAVARAVAAPVRQTAQIIMSDHQQVLSELQNLARDLHVTLPDSPDAMQQRQAQQLEGLSGTAFDHTYVQDEIKGHQMSIAQTRQEISSGSDQQVVQFAKSYLPGAEHHLDLVQHLSSSNDTSNGMGNPSNTSSSSTTPPSGVNAGSGGEAAASSGMPPAMVAGLAGGGALLVLTSGGALLARRRPE
jgi:putative membrane protein